MQQCLHSSPRAGAPCTRPPGGPCTYPSGRKDCGRIIATCADGRWSLGCLATCTKRDSRSEPMVTWLQIADCSKSVNYPKHVRCNDYT